MKKYILKKVDEAGRVSRDETNMISGFTLIGGVEGVSFKSWGKFIDLVLYELRKAMEKSDGEIIKFIVKNGCNEVETESLSAPRVYNGEIRISCILRGGYTLENQVTGSVHKILKDIGSRVLSEGVSYKSKKLISLGRSDIKKIEAKKSLTGMDKLKGYEYTGEAIIH